MLAKIQNFLTKLAIGYLRKRNLSVLIGFELKGGIVKALNSNIQTYDNEFNKVDYRFNDNSQFQIPDGKFSLKREG